MVKEAIIAVTACYFCLINYSKISQKLAQSDFTCNFNANGVAANTR